MYIISFRLFIVFSIVSPSFSQNIYRKYNVGQESFKLYGEDLKSVLKRFRRTSDYLKILQDKLSDLETSAKEMSLQVLHYYHGKLEERVIEIIPTTTMVAATSSSPVEDPKEDVYFHAHGNRRQDDEPTTASVEESWQKIHNLDNYKVFDSPLSVAERNSLRDLGFEFAGKIIHSIIENMAPKPEAGVTEKFTRIPEGGLSDENTQKTRTHSTQHAGTHKENNDKQTSPSTEEYPFRASEAPPK